MSTRAQSLLAYAVFLVPALVLAWFHYAAFRSFVVGVGRVYPGKPLPAAFEWLQTYGNVVYLLPVIVVMTGLLSSRYTAIRKPVAVALCGGALALACVCYMVFLSLPILTLGLSMEGNKLSYRTRIPAFSSQCSGLSFFGIGDSFDGSMVTPYFQSGGQMAMYRAYPPVPPPSFG